MWLGGQGRIICGGEDDGDGGGGRQKGGEARYDIEFLVNLWLIWLIAKHRCSETST